MPSLQPRPPLAGTRSAAVPAAERRWLLFVHQLPPSSSNLRVSTWRRLQQIGALPLKQAVYVLPDTPETREDVEWLKTEVQASGGEVTVFAAAGVDAWTDDALVDEFRRLRQQAYDDLARDVTDVLQRAGARRRPRGTRAPALRRLVDIFRERLAAAEKIDFFGSAGRDHVLAQLQQLQARLDGTQPTPGADAADGPEKRASFHQRHWVTRPRPGVDRMASAWLIRHFIDRQARFGFAADRGAVPADGVAFDMYGVEFTHQGDRCTFETLCAVFGFEDHALGRIAAIVHDLDLKDGKFGAPECGAVGAVIEGLQLTHADDHALLEQGITMFDSLYRSFEQATRRSGPRLAAGPPRRRASARPAPLRQKRGGRS